MTNTIIDTGATGAEGASTVIPQALALAIPSPKLLAGGGSAVASSWAAGSSFSGTQVWGAISAICTLGALIYVAINTSHRNTSERIQAERDYQDELRAAEERGAAKERVWTNYWRDVALGRIPPHTPPPQEKP